MPYQKEMKAVKLLQDRSEVVEKDHHEIAGSLDDLKKRLTELTAVQAYPDTDFESRRQEHLEAMNQAKPLESTPLSQIMDEAETLHPGKIRCEDILDAEGIAVVNHRLANYLADFNRHYSLDQWDYAIAGGCGLFAAMLDLLCIKAPLKPTVKFTQQVDGIFNRWVQEAFNKILPPDLSEALSKKYPIGAPDSSTTDQLLGAPWKALNPMNHRLRALSHDPVIGFIFGVLDMMRGTCTTVVEGRIISIPSTKGPTDGNIFQLLGRMFGHLASDVNAPSAAGNRGMGLPAPFMGLLRMLEGIPVGDSDFGKQIEWMYVNGYDFRQFVVTSLPMAIMEVLLRGFYVGKQIKLYQEPFGATLLDTMPTRLNPRFRIMLALAYGVSSSVNAGKMYVTGNILNANYASWMGLVWNGFHALKWALLDRQLKLWSEVEEKEIAALENTTAQIEKLEGRVTKLPV